MPEMKEVTEEHYAEVLDQHKDEVYQISFLGWQMPILHGLIALAADHPGVKELGWPTQDLITHIRWWCREKFSEWGFSPEEVKYLDTMRKEVKKMELSREQVTNTTIHNLIKAGLLLPREAQFYRKTLETYDDTTGLEVLAASRELREQKNEHLQAS